MSIEIAFDFQSVIDTGVTGTGAMGVRIDNNVVNIDMTLKYNESSTFRPGLVRSLQLSGVRDPKTKKVVASTTVGSLDQQVSISISFGGIIPIAYYSSILPLDAGTIKPRGHIVIWRDAFDMPR